MDSTIDPYFIPAGNAALLGKLEAAYSAANKQQSFSEFRKPVPSFSRQLKKLDMYRKAGYRSTSTILAIKKNEQAPVVSTLSEFKDSLRENCRLNFKLAKQREHQEKLQAELKRRNDDCLKLEYEMDQEFVKIKANLAESEKTLKLKELVFAKSLSERSNAKDSVTGLQRQISLVDEEIHFIKQQQSDLLLIEKFCHESAIRAASEVKDLESSALVALKENDELEAVIEALKKQTDSFDIQNSEIQDNLEKIAAEFDKLNNESSQSFKSEKSDELKTLNEKIYFYENYLKSFPEFNPGSSPTQLLSDLDGVANKGQVLFDSLEQSEPNLFSKLINKEKQLAQESRKAQRTLFLAEQKRHMEERALREQRRLKGN
jgi:hypothetical protein